MDDRLYDRCGNPITMGRWLDLNRDWSYKRVRETVVADVWRVSTVWLGIDHGFGWGPPLTFETMVFELAESHGYMPEVPAWGLLAHAYTFHESVMDDLQARYSTETQAVEGHEATVREARALFLPAVVA
jgi:hypothetical protein